MKKLINPVFRCILERHPNGSIVQNFGENPELYTKATNGLITAHNGIDIAMEEGTAILMSAGIIVEVKHDPSGYGKHIRLHTEPDEYGNYYEVTYGHLKEIFVPMGLKVPDGYTAGTMSNTGFIISGSTPFWDNAPAGRGVHLHFGVRECSLNPTPWQTEYSSGVKAYIKNYDNGMAGAIDPLPLIEPVLNKVTLLRAIRAALENIVKLLKGRYLIK